MIFCCNFAGELKKIMGEGDLTDAQLKQLEQIVEENKDLLLKQWEVFKNGGNVKFIKINK